MAKIKSVGITGTRHGITSMQRHRVLDWLRYNTANVLHHGDCIGADDEVAQMFAEDGTYIIAHPGDTRQYRANCKANDLILPPEANLARDRYIVRKAELMIGLPMTRLPQVRSGTWYTIRYTIKQKKPLILIFPDGTLEYDDNDKGLQFDS